MKSQFSVQLVTRYFIMDIFEILILVGHQKKYITVNPAFNKAYFKMKLYRKHLNNGPLIFTCMYSVYV